MLDLHRLPVAAGTNAKERDAVSMLRVHVRLYLEYKARENGLRRVHDARVAVARLRRGRPLGERVQNLPKAEVVDCRPEENGRLTACKEFNVPCGFPATPNDIEMRMKQGFSVFVMTWGDAGFKAVDLGRAASGRAATQ